MLISQIEPIYIRISQGDEHAFDILLMDVCVRHHYIDMR